MGRRLLTEGEIALAQALFRDSIDYAAVRIYDRGYAHLRVIGDMSWQGNIYLPQGHVADFSQAALPRQRLFIHETVHVWQYQNKVMNLALAAMREGVKHRFRYRRAYLFRLEAGKDLLDYGLEQQAAIIEEYFLTRHGGVSMGRCLNDAVDTQPLLHAVLANFLSDPSYARSGRTPIRPRRSWPGDPMGVCPT